ncbi:hypothetical protein ACFJGV_16055 [Cnuibacter sp. UC19_7]|uniref:hypothetical protein n=1 Tax=Cnuibacter sp. UC19_7 TaxID=3350166 RepID=UPI0036703FC1
MAAMTLVSETGSYTVERHANGIYRVSLGASFLGFVERAGGIYVALAGERYDVAVEVGQAHSLASAASALYARRGTATQIGFSTVA